MDELTQEQWEEDQQAEYEATVSQWQQHEEAMTTSKRDFLNELVKANHLDVNEDIFKMSMGGKQVAFITRTGIEKIQYINNIKVTFKLETVSKDFAVVKAKAIKEALDDDYVDLTIETYGSAWHGEGGNSRNNYVTEMAEKRAMARAVLKLCGAYKHGVYGEDEADDFRKKT